MWLKSSKFSVDPLIDSNSITDKSSSYRKILIHCQGKESRPGDRSCVRQFVVIKFQKFRRYKNFLSATWNNCRYLLISHFLKVVGRYLIFQTYWPLTFESGFSNWCFRLANIFLIYPSQLFPSNFHFVTLSRELVRRLGGLDP